MSHDQSERLLDRLPDEVIVTGSRYGGFNLSVEATVGEAWHYYRLRVSERVISVAKGRARPEEVNDTLQEIARCRGERPARYAAAHWDHMMEVFTYER